jgi:hypothetical protein
MEEINERRLTSDVVDTTTTTETTTTTPIPIPKTTTTATKTTTTTTTTTMSKNNKATSVDVWDIIDKVKQEVYTRIREYIDECTIILCDVLRLSLLAFSVQTCQKLFKERHNTFSEEESKQLSSLLDDIDYLLEMQRLESAPREKSMHIVPISGLCVGRVVRLESEMRTVVEVWVRKLFCSISNTKNNLIFVFVVCFRVQSLEH